MMGYAQFASSVLINSHLEEAIFGAGGLLRGIGGSMRAGLGTAMGTFGRSGSVMGGLRQGGRVLKGGLKDTINTNVVKPLQQRLAKPVGGVGIGGQGAGGSIRPQLPKAPPGGILAKPNQGQRFGNMLGGAAAAIGGAGMLNDMRRNRAFA